MVIRIEWYVVVLIVDSSVNSRAVDWKLKKWWQRVLLQKSVDVMRVS